MFQPFSAIPVSECLHISFGSAPSSHIHFWPIEIIRMYWKESSQPQYGRAGDSSYVTVPLLLSLARPSFTVTLITSSGKQESKPVDATGSCDCGPKCVGLDCDSTSGDAGVYHASSSSHQRFPYTVDLVQPSSAAASGQQDTNDTASQLAARHRVAFCPRR